MANDINFQMDGFTFNRSYNPSPKDITTHIHEGYELYYFISGDLTYYVEGQAYRLQPNDLILTNRRELHRIVFHSQEPYERRFIHFKPEFAVPLLQDESFNPLYYLERRKPGFFNRIDAREVVESGISGLWDRMEKLSGENTPENHFMIKLLFLQMLVEIYKIYSHKKDIVTDTAVNNEKILEILDYLNLHIEEHITLDLLEEKFYINKFYLSHVFKKSTGFTINEYVTYKRIIKAKELLSRKMSVQEVSDATGFGDYSNFYKSFKRIVGCSPKKYVNSQS